MKTAGHKVSELSHTKWDQAEQLLAERPQVIVHLGSYGNHSTQRDVREIYQANLLNALTLFEHAQGYKALIVTGSSSEYGRKRWPMKEDHLLEPNTLYGASKAAQTLLAKVWAETHDLPIVTVRPFSVYGPGEADFRFIPTAIRCALTGETLTLAPGVHDWIYIDDFLDGLETVIRNADKIKGQVVNIGTGRQERNDTIVGMIELLTGKDIKHQTVDSLRPYDTTQAWVANNALLQKLGWTPRYTIEEGLAETIKHYEGAYKKNS